MGDEVLQLCQIVAALNFIFFPSSLLESRKCFSTDNADNNSFVVSYLVNSCGFSQQHVVHASQHVHFKTPEKSDSVIAFLKDRDFSETQIFTIIRKFPKVLVSNPCKTLLPKFDFFYSKGISSHQLVEILCIYPHILKSSLGKRLIPNFNYFTNMLQSEEMTFEVTKRYGGILCKLLKGQMITNINMLRENGVPESSIGFLLRNHPRAISLGSNRFKETIKEVKQIGFDPLRLKFVLAFIALRSMSRTKWENKVDCYKKWGWSDEDILVAFRMNPWCMLLSEEKITHVMNYFTNVLGLDRSLICKRPALLLYSLKKRIVPRGSVAKALLSRGLIDKRSLASLFYTREELFLDNFVKPYEEEVPELLKKYTDELDLSKKLVSEIR